MGEYEYLRLGMKQRVHNVKLVNLVDENLSKLLHWINSSLCETDAVERAV